MGIVRQDMASLARRGVYPICSMAGNAQIASALAPKHHDSDCGCQRWLKFAAQMRIALAAPSHYASSSSARRQDVVMIYTHVLKVGGSVNSPLDALAR
jgi:hypothetical protein